jgi:signal-transduction protein with cAMP-binding, CBS, and nucleotidyltransferase domain
MTTQDSIWSEHVAQLHLKAAIICNESDSVRDCIDRMQDSKDPFIVIVDSNGHLSGVFTGRDVMNCYVGTNLSDETMVMAVMNRRAVTTQPQDTLHHVINQMGANDVSQLAVLENKKVIGVITIEAILDHLGTTFPHELFNISPLKNPSSPLQRNGG